MDNPLLDFYSENFRNYYSMVRPNKFRYPNGLTANMKLRDQAIKNYSWAVPNLKALETIAKLGPIVEWYAGAGYWAYCLRQLGGQITSYSMVPGNQGESIGNSKCWTYVHKCSEVAPLAIGGKTLLVVWPPLGIGIVDKVLSAFTGSYVVHVGEDSGNQEFHTLLHDKWSLLQMIEIPQWEGIHDAVYIWCRGNG